MTHTARITVLLTLGVICSLGSANLSAQDEQAPTTGPIGVPEKCYKILWTLNSSLPKPPKPAKKDEPKDSDSKKPQPAGKGSTKDPKKKEDEGEKPSRSTERLGPHEAEECLIKFYQSGDRTAQMDAVRGMFQEAFVWTEKTQLALISAMAPTTKEELEQVPELAAMPIIADPYTQHFAIRSFFLLMMKARSQLKFESKQGTVFSPARMGNMMFNYHILGEKVKQAAEAGFHDTIATKALRKLLLGKLKRVIVDWDAHTTGPNFETRKYIVQILGLVDDARPTKEPEKKEAIVGPPLPEGYEESIVGPPLLQKFPEPSDFIKTGECSQGTWPDSKTVEAEVFNILFNTYVNDHSFAVRSYILGIFSNRFFFKNLPDFEAYVGAYLFYRELSEEQIKANQYHVPISPSENLVWLQILISLPEHPDCYQYRYENLVAALQKPDLQMRKLAIQGLGLIKNGKKEEAKKTLLAVIQNSPSTYERHQAAYTLLRHREDAYDDLKAILPALKKTMASEKPDSTTLTLWSPSLYKQLEDLVERYDPSKEKEDQKKKSPEQQKGNSKTTTKKTG